LSFDVSSDRERPAGTAHSLQTTVGGTSDKTTGKPPNEGIWNQKLQHFFGKERLFYYFPED